jgi:hypothetical protein
VAPECSADDADITEKDRCSVHEVDVGELFNDGFDLFINVVYRGHLFGFVVVLVVTGEEIDLFVGTGYGFEEIVVFVTKGIADVAEEC